MSSKKGRGRAKRSSKASMESVCSSEKSSVKNSDVHINLKGISNLSEEVLKATAEPGGSLDVPANSLNSSSLLEKSSEADLHLEDCSDRKGNSHDFNTESHQRAANDKGRMADGDESIEDSSNNVEGFRNQRELLMRQIKSFIRDPDIDNFSKSQSLQEDVSFRRSYSGGLNSNLNMEIEKATKGFLDDVCTTDDKSHRDHYTVDGDGKCDPGNNTATEDQCEPGNESANNRSERSISRENFFGVESRDLEIALELLLSLRDVCFEEETLSKQHERHVLKQFKGLEGDEHCRAEETEVLEDTCSTSSLLPTSDQPDENSEHVKERVRCLLKRFDDFLERKHFSSAFELEQFLEIVEKMKNVMSSERWLQFQRQQNSEHISEAVPFNMKIENAKSLDESIAILSIKANGNMNRLSVKLIQWQEFNETRADLEYELGQDRRVLQSIEARINRSSSDKADLELEHDLEFVEEMEKTYYDKLTKLRRFNHELMELLDDDTLANHRSQLGTVANELQYIKTSCSRLRENLGLPNSPSKKDVQFRNEREISRSICIQTDDVDGSNKVSTSVSLLKMLLVLLIILLLVAFVFFLEPRSFRSLNSLRLPVPFHLRHVGTYPPV